MTLNVTYRYDDMNRNFHEITRQYTVRGTTPKELRENALGVVVGNVGALCQWEAWINDCNLKPIFQAAGEGDDYVVLIG